VGALADAFGAAYGLDGTHREWASTPQQELGARIAAKLPEMMQSAGRPTAIDGAADAFFGEAQALEAMGDPFPRPAPTMPQPAHEPPGAVAYPMAASPGGAASHTTFGGDDLVPMGVPKSNAMWIVAALVGGLALVLGVVLVLVIFG
jgi:hypothetical protein